MNILFVHQNFPGQFKHLAPALVNKGHTVKALLIKRTEVTTWEGVSIEPYLLARSTSKQIHPWVIDFETKVIRAEACFKKCMQLKQNGFNPDVIVAHHGWGETLFIKEVWPEAKLGIYCEFFYNSQGADTGFDPEFSNPEETNPCRLRIKNLTNLLHFDIADAALSPTHWQASTYPKEFRTKISVVHEGIDTESLVPVASVSVTMPNGDVLTKANEVVTYVARNLEPYRGYHVFMRALPNLLRSRPELRVIIVGGEGVSYGVPSANGKTWKKTFIDEVSGEISPEDWNRVFFLGQIQYDSFVALLKLSTVHVYLTYPFVLSWSLLEAMSSACAIVASDTPPVREAIQHEKTGVLVDFFNPVALADRICELLDDPERRARLGAAARRHAVENYDLRTRCLPQQIRWVEGLAAH